MLDFTKEERLVLVFFAGCLLVGTGINFYKDKFNPGNNRAEHLSKSIPNKTRRECYVNINKADITQLITLKGIGKKTAYRILQYRTENGPFISEDEIMNVKGIGRSKFDLIKDKITVE